MSKKLNIISNLNMILKKMYLSLSKALDFTKEPNNDLIINKLVDQKNITPEPVNIKPIPQKIENVTNNITNNKLKSYIITNNITIKNKTKEIKSFKHIKKDKDINLSPLLSLFPKDEDSVYVLVKLTEEGHIIDSAPYVLKQNDGTILIGLMEELLEGILD